LDQFLTHLLSEDVVAIEAIQQVFDSLGPDNCPEISQRADVGGGRARRIIAEMIARERPAAVD
jgi:vanillate O-demethylase monooxygenase subunit